MKETLAFLMETLWVKLYLSRVLCMSGVEMPAGVPSSQRLWKKQLLCPLVSGCPGHVPGNLVLPLLEHSIRLGALLSRKIIWIGFAAGTPFKESIIISLP